MAFSGSHKEIKYLVIKLTKEMKDLFRHFKPLNSKSIIKTHSERIHTPKKIETRSIKYKFIKTSLNYVKNFSLIIVMLGI